MPAAQYRKKPVVIEAIRIAEIVAAWRQDPLGELPDWVLAGIRRGILLVTADQQLLIETAEGLMLGNHDDWLIQGIAGELYACKPEIFDGTYEAVAET